MIKDGVRPPPLGRYFDVSLLFIVGFWSMNELFLLK